MRLLVACAFAATVALAPPAAQAQTPAGYGVPWGIVTTSEGRDVAGFIAYPGRSAVLTAEGPDGSFTPFARTPGTTAFRRLAIAGGDEITGAYGVSESYGGGDKGGGTTWLGAAVFAGRPGAPLGPALDVFRRGPDVAVRELLAANRRGDAAAVVTAATPPYVLMRPAGRRFRRPAAPLGGLTPTKVAVLDDGSAVVFGVTGASQDLGVVAVDPSGQPGPVQRITRDPVQDQYTRVATAPGGRAAVLWQRTGRDTLVRLARRAGTGRAFGRPITVAQGGVPKALAIDASGRVLAVFTQWDGQAMRYRAVVVEPSGRAGEPFWLSAPDRVLYNEPALAANERGEVVVAWPQQPRGAGGGSTGPMAVVARVGTVAGAFGPPLTLSSPRRRTSVGIHASIAPSGRASVLWSDGPPEGSRDVRMWVTHLDRTGAAPPVELAPDATSARVLGEEAPPLREVRIGRSARAGARGRLRLRLRCRSWIPGPCRGAVRLSRSTRARFSVPAQSTERVSLRLRGQARRTLARRGVLRLRATVRMTGPRAVAGGPSVAIRRR